MNLLFQFLIFGILFQQFSQITSAKDVPEFLDTLPVNLGDGSIVEISYVIEDDSIFLSLFTKFQPNATAAWIGFGISERKVGSMKGSDIVTVEAKADGEFQIQDRHLGWVSYPMTPERSFPGQDDLQDWELEDAKFDCDDVSCDFTAIISRKLDTGDTEQDRVIDENDKNRIIAARGLGEFVSYHGAGRGSGIIDFTKPVPSADISDLIPGPVDRTVDILMNNYSGASDWVTTYACQSFSFDLADDEVFDVVAFEPLLEEKNIEQLHHMLLFSCERPHLVDFTESFDSCEELYSESGGSCSVIIYAWAIGGGNLVFPEDIALRLKKGELTDVALEFHYDNPRIKSFTDSSGVRLHLTKTLREHEAGVLTLGDPGVTFKELEAQNACINRQGVCPTECSSNFEQPVQAFMNLHHMHARGRQSYTKLNGEITSKLDYWDQSFQDFGDVDFIIKPGDVLETVCNYDNAESDEPVPFDLGSLDEMCQDFIYYYPKINSGVGCGFIDLQGEDTLCNFGILPGLQDQFQGEHLKASFLSEATPCVVEPPPNNNPPVGNDKDSTEIIIYAVVGVAVAAFIIIGAIIVTRKEKTPAKDTSRTVAETKAVTPQEDDAAVLKVAKIEEVESAAKEV